MMIEHQHGAYLHRENPFLIATIIRRKREQFNLTPQVRKGRKRR